MELGSQIGSYRIERKLGEGGMGVVYVGVDLRLGRRAALKQLLPELSGRRDIVERFFNEAKAAANINHPGIVPIYEVGWHDGSAYYAMKLLEGDSLARRLRAGPMLLTTACAVAQQIASALVAAHAIGIVHRDLKPDNIILVRDDAVTLGERAIILDFGLAKLTGDWPTFHKTRTDSVMGTAQYMPPEQCGGSGEVDHRADVYATGCILFEMLTGRPPFEGAYGELIGKHQFVAPPTVRSLCSDVLPELETLVMRCLAKQPDERYQTMTELSTALQTLLSLARSEGGVLPPLIDASTPTPPQNGPRTVRLRPRKLPEREPPERELAGCEPLECDLPEQEPIKREPAERERVAVVAPAVDRRPYDQVGSKLVEHVAGSQSEVDRESLDRAPLSEREPPELKSLECEPPEQEPVKGEPAGQARKRGLFGVVGVAAILAVVIARPAGLPPLVGASSGTAAPTEAALAVTTEAALAVRPAGAPTAATVAHDAAQVATKPDTDSGDRDPIADANQASVEQGRHTDHRDESIPNTKSYREKIYQPPQQRDDSGRSDDSGGSNNSGGSELPQKLDIGMFASGIAMVKSKALECGKARPPLEKNWVQLAVTVGPDGRVTSVIVSDTPDTTLGSCVADLAWTATFQKTQEGGSFQCPFYFWPEPATDPGGASPTATAK